MSQGTMGTCSIKETPLPMSNEEFKKKTKGVNMIEVEMEIIVHKVE